MGDTRPAVAEAAGEGIVGAREAMAEEAVSLSWLGTRDTPPGLADD